VPFRQSADRGAAFFASPDSYRELSGTIGTGGTGFNKWVDYEVIRAGDRVLQSL